MPEMMVSNPRNSQWWKSRLLWLLESNPKQALEMWNSPNHEKLLHHLDFMAESAEKLMSAMTGTPDDIVQELIAAEYCPMTDFPDEELSEELQIEILEWAEKVRGEEAEMDDVGEKTEGK